MKRGIEREHHSVPLSSCICTDIYLAVCTVQSQKRTVWAHAHHPIHIKGPRAGAPGMGYVASGFWDIRLSGMGLGRALSPVKARLGPGSLRPSTEEPQSPSRLDFGIFWGQARGRQSPFRSVLGLLQPSSEQGPLTQSHSASPSIAASSVGSLFHPTVPYRAWSTLL